MSPFCVKLTVPLTELPLVGGSPAVADCFLLKRSLVALQPATNTKPQTKIQTDFISLSRYLHWLRQATTKHAGFSIRSGRCQISYPKSIADTALQFCRIAAQWLSPV